ncbi:hypothetical protein JCM16303_004091 [Sporobolomyces ruberrimus]
MDLDTEANRIKASVETLDNSVLAVGLNCAKLVKCFQAALEDQGGRNALQSLSHEDRQIVKDCIQDLNRHLLAIKSHETWKDRKKAESQARGLHVLMSADVLAIRSVLKHSKFRDEWKAVQLTVLPETKIEIDY